MAVTPLANNSFFFTSWFCLTTTSCQEFLVGKIVFSNGFSTFLLILKSFSPTLTLVSETAVIVPFFPAITPGPAVVMSIFGTINKALSITEEDKTQYITFLAPNLSDR